MKSQSKRVVFVPSCLLCPIFQAKYDSTKLVWRKEIMQALMDTGVGIVQMPCPEASFDGYNEGLSRKSHGVRFYEKLPGFPQHCKDMASQMLEQIIALEDHGIQVKAILGIENSPTCAVSWIFTHGVGAERRMGLFIGELARQLNLEGKAIPFIGITRHKEIQKKEIEQLMEAIQS